MADSQVLRWLDELNGITDADSKAREIKSEIRRLRKEQNSVQNRRRIKQLYAQLDDIQFKPDYMCLIIDKEKDYHRACSGFSINGLKYQRLLGTNGGVKNETIVFVSERHAEEIRRRIDNGRDPEKEMVPAKLEAYKALTCSASTPVSMPNGILVVSDCETEFLSDIIYLNDEADGEPVMEERKQVLVELNESDGYGLMSPELAARWSSELGLDYVVSGVNTRFSWEKGMVFTFDFLDFAEKIAGTYMVKDAWGNEVDIRNVELILTTSMLKLWDSYESCDAYVENCLKNKYTLAFNDGEIADGTEIVVFYNRQIQADVLENLSDNYSGKCALYIDAFAEDKCANVFRIQFYIPKADFNGEFSLEIGGDSQVVHNFEAESLAGACGTSGALWTYTIFGANAEDVA